MRVRARTHTHTHTKNNNNKTTNIGVYKQTYKHNHKHLDIDEKAAPVMTSFLLPKFNDNKFWYTEFKNKGILFLKNKVFL